MMAESTKEQDKLSERTCAGCRAHATREELVRFVVGPDARVVPDVFRKLPGRGASVHPRMACLRAAATKGGFTRSFATELRVDADALRTDVLRQCERRFVGLLLGASRSKSLVVGTEAVRDAMTKGPVLLVAASDAAGRRDELEERAAALGGHAVVFGTKASLGAMFGRDELGILAILDEGIANAVRDVAGAMASLAEGE